MSGLNKRGFLIGILLVLLLLLSASASALTIEAEPARPFGENRITVRSGAAGTLTIHAACGSLSLEDPVTDLEITDGITELTWDALTYGDEPVMRGVVDLHAVLTPESGETVEAFSTVSVGRPHPAVVACLPVSAAFWPGSAVPLKIECQMSEMGTCYLEIASGNNPEEVVCRQKQSTDKKGVVTFQWNGRDLSHNFCAPGEYIVSAWSKTMPGQVRTAELTVRSEPVPVPDLFLTGDLVPSDLNDDAAVWEALMAPVVTGIGGEGKGLIILDRSDHGRKRAGSVNSRTVGLAVLEMPDADGWVRVGAWRQKDSVYVEGYVQASSLQVILPNPHYGMLLDKKNQTLTVYENGQRLGTFSVSTGLINRGMVSETGSGVYLLGSRLGGFNDDGYSYQYAIRIDGFNLIHSVGYRIHNSRPDYSDQLADLGRKASHGCVRMDVRGENGLNAWWVWTHLPRDTKIIITGD